MATHPFFTKLRQLRDTLPHLPYNLRVYRGYENSNTPYCDEVALCSDCHMCFTCGETSRSLYSNYLQKSNECLDCDNGLEMQLCRECTGYSEKCYACSYCHGCKGCFSSHFCDHCQNLTDCFGCVEIDNKKFCIFNKQYSADDYARLLPELMKKSLEENLKAVEKLRRQLPVNAAVEYENIDCTLQGYGFFNNRCHNLSYSRENEDCAHLFESNNNKSSAESNLIFQNQLVYEVNNSDMISHSAFIIDSGRLHSSYFSSFCHDCSNCFGCLDLEFKDYHILNKPYSPEEYQRQVERLLREFQEQKIDVAEEWYKIWSMRECAESKEKRKERAD